MIEAVLEQTHFNDHARIACPECTRDRKKTRSKDMTLTRKPDGSVLYFCHHCGVNGIIPTRDSREHRKERYVQAVPKIVDTRLEEEHYLWLESRGISRQTADEAKLFSARKFFNKLEREESAIGFPYFRDGTIVAAKYRAVPDKAFTQDSGGAHDFFGMQWTDKTKPLVIVEGEIDVLSAKEAGIENVVSVPGGAPLKVADGKVLPSEDKKFAFVWNARELLDAVPYVVLATDQDPPGQALAEELARRIGKDKCRLAKFDSKDFNEILNDPSRNGKEEVQRIVQAAEPYPIAGLSDAGTFEERVNDLYTKGQGSGFSTGYSSLDTVYTVAPGQLTVVTGYPSSGKSNFVDQLMVNLARDSDWKFAVASFENSPEIHISRLMEIYTRKRFFEGRDRMTEKEKEDAFTWVKEHFLFIDSAGEEPNTLESILTRARAAVKRMGVRGMVIDPYNYIDLDRRDTTETDAISQMLTKVQRFCKAQDVHTWFVAHPSKMQRAGTDQPRPDGMSISGSMAWWAKADCGLTVHRQDKYVEIAVWKCRYRWVGTQGETTLLFNRTAGTYTENLDAF